MSNIKMKQISTTNLKIVSFFNTHKTLDFDETILSFINIIERLEDNVNSNPSNQFIHNILSKILN